MIKSLNNFQMLWGQSTTIQFTAILFNKLIFTNRIWLLVINNEIPLRFINANILILCELATNF